jgi:hypothetical protein
MYQLQIAPLNMQKSLCHFLVAKIRIVRLILVYVTKQACIVKRIVVPCKLAVKYIFHKQKCFTLHEQSDWLKRINKLTFNMIAT